MTENQQTRHLLLKNLETLVQKCLCFLCKEKIQCPVTTSCGHHFCRACIMNVVRSRREAVCPTCKEKVTEKSIVVNERTSQLFESLDLLLKACKDELKLTVEPVPAAATPKVKKVYQKPTVAPVTQKNTPTLLKRQTKIVPATKEVQNEEKKKPKAPEISKRVTLPRRTCVKETSAKSSPVLPEKQINPENKVSSWLKNASTDAIPTQDHTVLPVSPNTQSTLVSVSQSKDQLMTNKYTRLLTIPTSTNKERMVKDPYEFIPSQPDSIVKKGKEKVKSKPPPIRKAKQPVTLRKKSTVDVEKVPEKSTAPEMLLFQSQSEQYIAAQEEKRLKEIEKPVDFLPPKVKRQRVNLKAKVAPKKSDTDEQKIQQKIEEAEKYNLLVENKKTVAKVKQPFQVVQVEPRKNNKRRLSADIKSVAASSTPKRVIFNVSSSDSEDAATKTINKTGANLKLASPGFSRLKKMKSDFRSPAKVVVVPLDVSTSSVPQRHLDTTEPSDQHSEHTSARIDTSSPQPQKQKPPDSPNSTYSSIGHPDFEKVAALQNIVGQLENELLQDNEVTIIGDTQASMAFIENSEPNETILIVPPGVQSDSTDQSPTTQLSHSARRTSTPLKELSANQTDTQMSETCEKAQDSKPPRKTFSLESDTGDIMTDIPSRESTQQQLISLTSQNKSEQAVAKHKPAASVIAPRRSLVKFVKQGRLSEGARPSQVASFLRLGFLAPGNLKKGVKYLPLRCYCKGVAPKAAPHPVRVPHHSTEVQTSQSPVSQHTIQVQTSPSLAQLKSMGVQTSTQGSDHPSSHSEARGAQTSQSSASSGTKPRVQEEHSASPVQGLKCSQELFKFPPEPRVPSLDDTLFDDEMEEEEVTVIEKSQEDNVKIISPRTSLGRDIKTLLKPALTGRNFNQVMSQCSTEGKEITQEESMNIFTINSDDILQASICEPIRKSIFERNLMDENSSPTVDHKSSNATSPLSRNESDFNECEEIMVKGSGKYRKRSRARIISSDSETEDPNPTPLKRVSRLSIKKKVVVVPETPGSSLTSDSDLAPVRAVVIADLAHARAVAALPSDEDSSVVTINLESQSPLVASSPLISRTPAPESANSGGVMPRSMAIGSKSKEDSLLGALHDEVFSPEEASPFLDESVLSLTCTNHLPQESTEEHCSPATPQPRTAGKPSEFSTPTTRGVQAAERKQCEESDSDPDIIIESTPLRKLDVKTLMGSPPTPPVRPRPAIAMVYSQLDFDSIKLVDRFLKKFRTQVSHSEAFLPETTHVVVPYENGGHCSATLKFLLAVASGRWVVSIHWVRDCMQAERLLPEEPYEVLNAQGLEGPKMSRLGTSRLFKDFEVHCSDGDYKFILKKHLEEVVSYGGGKLIELSQLKSPSTRKYRIVLIPTETVPTGLQDCRCVVLLLDWVIESVEQHRLATIANHLGRAIDDQLATEQGFPSEMLDDEESTSYGSTMTSTMTSAVTPS